jgi:hypothetical protein
MLDTAIQAQQQRLPCRAPRPGAWKIRTGYLEWAEMSCGLAFVVKPG